MHSTFEVNEAINNCTTGTLSRGPGFSDRIFSVSKECPEFNHLVGGRLVGVSDRVFDIFARATNNPRRLDDVRAFLIEVLHQSVKGKSHSSRGNRKEHRFQIVVTGMGADQVYTLRAVCGPCDGYGPAITFMLADE